MSSVAWHIDWNNTTGTIEVPILTWNPEGIAVAGEPLAAVIPAKTSTGLP